MCLQCVLGLAKICKTLYALTLQSSVYCAHSLHVVSKNINILSRKSININKKKIIAGNLVLFLLSKYLLRLFAVNVCFHPRWWLFWQFVIHVWAHERELQQPKDLLFGSDWRENVYIGNKLTASVSPWINNVIMNTRMNDRFRLAKLLII